MSVISIQSHVALGHVGNSAAVFALQRSGVPVWPVHTLQFSNHPGYGDHAGATIEPRILADMLAALERREAFACCRAVLTGYLGTPEIAEVVATWIERIKATRPDLVYCCDPVIGDVETGRYVADGIPEVLSARLVPLADVVTPNTFELAHLISAAPPAAGAHGRSNPIAAARALLGRGPRLAIVTSVPGGAEAMDSLAIEADAAWRVSTPSIELGRRPDGAGDLFTALYLARWLDSGDPRHALEHAASAVYSMLDATRRSGAREMPLVTHQDLLVSPATTVRAVSIEA